MALSKYMPLLVVATLAQLKTHGSENDGQIAELQGATSFDDGLQGRYRWDADNTTTADDDKYIAATGVTVGRWVRVGCRACRPTVTAPSSGSITMQHFPGPAGTHRTLFTLAAARVAVTDAAASGSHGSIVIATMPQGSIRYLGCRQNYTAFAEGSALTGGAGDAVFDIGVGTVAKSAAADGALGGANDDDIGDEIAITLSGGTGTGTDHTASAVAHDGTTTASTLNLNWSGTAATIDANSYIDVTGTIEVIWSDMGDD